MWLKNPVGLITRVISRGAATNISLKRRFLSPAFLCEDSWKKRLQTPIIKKCVLDDFYYELDTKYNQTENINPVDVDIFVNAIADSSYLEEMQDLVHKMRMSSEAVNIMPSTHHAFIRNLLECKEYEDLFVVLNDRLNYGIFPDDYCNLLMFNIFIKDTNYRSAAKVATYQMLQEDFSNPLIKYFSLYSCHQYLLNPSEWEKAKEVITQDDEEEIKVRVRYIRNPFFDEHFDLTESDDLIGKTFIMISKDIEAEIGKSYELLGSILFKKFILAQNILKSILENKGIIFKDVYSIIMNCINNKLKESENDPNLESVKIMLEECVKNKLINENDALPIIENEIKKHVKELEGGIITQQQEIYDKWIETRHNLLTETLDRIKKEDKLERVRLVKKELTTKEQELFFFDREDQLDLEIEKKQVAKAANVKRNLSRKGGTDSSDYVPPEIVKRRNSN